MLTTTTGQILVNEALPPKLRDYSRVLDKKGVKALAEQLAAENDPELYREVMKALYDIGHEAAHSSGVSFSIRDLKAPPAVEARMEVLRKRIRTIVETVEDPDKRDDMVRDLVRTETPNCSASSTAFWLGLRWSSMISVMRRGAGFDIPFSSSV